MFFLEPTIPTSYLVKVINSLFFLGGHLTIEIGISPGVVVIPLPNGIKRLINYIWGTNYTGTMNNQFLMDGNVETTIFQCNDLESSN